MLLPPYQSFHSRKFVSLLPLTSYFGQATHLYMLFQLHHLRLPPPLLEAKRVPWLFQGAGTRKTRPNLTSVMQLPAQALHYQRQIWRAYLCIALMDPHPGEYTHPKHLPDFTGVLSWTRQQDSAARRWQPLPQHLGSVWPMPISMEFQRPWSKPFEQRQLSPNVLGYWSWASQCELAVPNGAICSQRGFGGIERWIKDGPHKKWQV